MKRTKIGNYYITTQDDPMFGCIINECKECEKDSNPPTRGSSVQKADTNITMNLNVKDIQAYAIGMMLYNDLHWDTDRIFSFTKIIGFDKDTQEITVDEAGLLRLIQLVNEGQPSRCIRLI